MRTKRAISAVVSAVLAVGLSAQAAHAAGHNPGVVGKRITLATGLSLATNAYDVATDDSGTAYIGWISSSVRSTAPARVHLCVLPTGASSCKGGVQTMGAIDWASAADLKVLSTPSGRVTMLWFHDTAQSGTGSEGSQIAEVTALHGMNPSTPHDVAPAPSQGELFDAEYAPNGKIWLATEVPLPARRMQVTPGIGAPFKSVQTPWSAGGAQLAFSGGKAVLAIDKYGAVSAPAEYATSGSSGAFGKFSAVKGTWTTAGSALKNTPHGLRLIAGQNDASYRPVIARWNGHGFSKPMSTADKNACAPSTHDASRDSSGRLLDVSNECGRVTVADYADDTHSAIYRFNAESSSTTVTEEPQIASGVRGIATVVWSNETNGQTGDTLHAVRVALPDTTRTVHKHGAAGRVNLIGPTSCLPPVLVHVKIGASPAKGWRVETRTLKLGSRTVHSRRIDGATLTPGKSYTLNGSVVFKKHSKHSTIRAALKFTTCARR